MLQFLTPKETSHHPILFSEPAWNTKVNRERMTEILFEKFQVINTGEFPVVFVVVAFCCCWVRPTMLTSRHSFVPSQIPAFYVAKNAALTCFANGRHTGLVLDCGAIHTSAIPVYDGLVLAQEIVRSPLAGDFLVQQAQRLLDDLKVDLVPYYRIASKVRRAVFALSSPLVVVSDDDDDRAHLIPHFTCSHEPILTQQQVNEREPARWKERGNLPKVTTSYEHHMTKVSIHTYSPSLRRMFGSFESRLVFVV